MTLKIFAVLTLITAATVAQAVTPAQTVKAYELGMAEARAEISRAKSERQLAELLAKYQGQAFRSCSVSLFFANVADSVTSRLSYAKNFSWGVIVGNDIIRRHYRIEGSRIQAANQLGNDAAVAILEDTRESYTGQYGVCTMINDKMKLVQDEIERRNSSINTVTVDPNGNEVPLIIIEPGSQKH